MIGYLSVKKIDEKHVGGLLVVDESGIPHEFKYTDPIIPNQLQKILYGKSLETYLHVEIISKSLLKKIENKPDIIFTDNPVLIESGENVFFTSSFIPSADETESSPEECVIPYGSSAIRFVSKQQISQEKEEKLKQILDQVDVLEPFQRLEKALEYVCRSSSS
ncbi:MULTISPECIES: hypothetical protein [Pseudothermotoga]|jgi:hypothetical protein|uniref:Uncharacterized protein n=1 Tax=Pseudothermotoga lettingae (strain ATCC BAA-301 / DSM 14385 / NBRC 107922 / TMO) TaxID=416591 RepID=A8F4U7_PSELT|nr:MULTISPECIES: hypothetical protein [Pseudothermotoga]ABV33181.1 conserved hypothetical protein [Pseudothermotoga lettingae TMO]KUK19960.1 MAG: Uncharacterized protein XD56_2126 [Pseudothermotoga lettingae]GLI49902.1 hypothetical protein PLETTINGATMO_20710 [Pseudothermotoga lettingae TMO]HBJ81711.1 hypothetical protein [Pseudothermotoga sp.]